MQYQQRAVIKFLTAEQVTPTEIHRRLKAIHVDDVIVDFVVLSLEKS